VDPNPDARPPLAEILSLYHGKDIPQTVTHPPQPAVEVVNAPVNADRIVRLDTRRRTPLVPVLTAVFGLLILFSLWWIKNNTARRRQVPSPDGKTLTRQTAPAAPPVVPQAAAPVAPQAAAPVTSQAAPEQSPSRDVTQEVEPRTTNGPIWRVVLWTYSKRSDAQNKVDYLATRYPTLQPEVFTPDANGGMYLVVVGGEMTRKQAEDTEFKARQLGLPRDTYIQNFSH
jgi:cell division septation protein DedD